MVRLWRGLALLAAVIAATPAWAQEGAPTAAQAPASLPGHTVEPLTVMAPKDLTPKEMEALATRFVRALSEPGRLGQLSRWMTPLCPKAIGLPDAFDAFITARIQAVADDVGAPKAASPCKANNVLIVFTTKPQLLLDAISRKRAELLGFHYAAQTKRLSAFHGPAQAWYVTATVADGVHYLDTEFSQMPGGTPGSRLSASLASAFDAVLVIIDTAAIAGQPVGKIADDAAMLTLARSPGAKGCRELPTILDAMRGDCAPSAAVDGLTSSDLAYLKGLYSADPKQFLSLQKSQIATSVIHDLKARP